MYCTEIKSDKENEEKNRKANFKLYVTDIKLEK